MLTEVSFCITCYLGVLAIEYVPLVLENRKLGEIRELRLFGHNLDHIMAIFMLGLSFRLLEVFVSGFIFRHALLSHVLNGLAGVYEGKRRKIQGVEGN